MAALLTASVGVSVQQIYCYCMGVTTVSLLSAEDACADPKRPDAPACCQKEESEAASCCEQKHDACAGEHDGCMEKTTKVFQLKTEFVVDKPFEKTFDCPLWIEKMPVFRRYFRPVVCEANILNQPQPPPLSGRDICVRLQTFRC